MKSITVFTVTFCILANGLIANPVKEAKPGESVPRDYAYSPNGSRVSELVGFFESMKNFDVYNDKQRENQNVIANLGEAASKLRVLLDGYPLMTKCSKYVKLIRRPNIRTFSGLSLLAREDIMFDEKFQQDANLISRLTSERSFDALGRIQTIVQSLESEREGLKSLFEPKVQKDLLDCINYYIYRHREATTDLVKFTRQESSKLPNSVVDPSASDILIRKFEEARKRVELVEETEEKEKRKMTSEWLKNVFDLHKLIADNQWQIPKTVQDFIWKSGRLERLNRCNQMLEKARELGRNFRESMSRMDEISAELDDLVNSNSDWFPRDIIESAQQLKSAKSTGRSFSS